MHFRKKSQHVWEEILIEGGLYRRSHSIPLTLSTRQAWADDNKKVFKNVIILEIGDYIWNQHEKCIQISTNMPDIGSEMCDILRILETKRFHVDGETNGRV